jgi:hypothetical protein
MRTWFRRSPERFDAGSLKARLQTLSENLELLRLPITSHAGARRQAALVRELRVLFPTRELAGAAYELNLEPEKAAPLVPEINRHAFFSYYQSRVGPGYNPWSY